MTTTTTAVEELLEELAPAAPEIDAPPKEEVDLRRLSQRTPPSNGLCRRCGRNKPINRVMLCYPCWVKSELESKGWREGQPHPDWCRCEGLREHARLSDGN